jgi:hypothetical protein
MKDFLGFFLLFAIFGIAIYALLGGLSIIHSANVGDCAPDVNGTIVNCSLSDDDYAQLNKTSTILGQTTQIESTMLWVILLGVIVSGAVLLRRKKA